MKIRILSEADARRCSSMREAIEWQREAFGLYSDGQVMRGLHKWIEHDHPQGLIGYLPGVIKDGGGFGIKMLSFFYDERTNIPETIALVMVWDGKTGFPRALIEGTYVTDLRTGAASGLAIDFLARKDSRVAAMFGAGRVARNQVEALCEVREVETVFVYSRTESRARAYIEEMSAKGPPIPNDFRLVKSSRDAVAEADVLITGTTSHTPVFDGRDLREGTCVIAAGGCVPESGEVDVETIRRSSKIVVDMKETCVCGELAVPIKLGVIREEDIAELGELVLGKRSGRETEDEVTFCKTIGVPIQDLNTGRHILERAEALGLGQVVEL